MGGINIGNVESGATINITVIDYQDGISQSTIPKVKTLFEEGRAYYAKKEFDKAIDKFKVCLELEQNNEKLGALNTQTGNCYYELRAFIKAAEFYETALKAAQKANDTQGVASALCNIANTYMLRLAADGAARGENVRKAVEQYTKALQIFTRDEYPVGYAMTQNNLGIAYTHLLAATSQERAENVKNAVKCYKAVLEIRKKDEYPQDYCYTAANLGILLVSIDNKESCYWLKQAYDLREFLPDQGKRLEELIETVSK